MSSRNRNKLIIYTDGSYANGKSGWAFHFSCNKNNSPWILGYGSYASNGSAQSEVIACIEALNYLPDIEDKRFNDIEMIEIRLDFIEVVKFINHYSKPKFDYKLQTGNYSCYTSELLELIKVIKKLPVDIRAKKVNKKDLLLLKVHQAARYSLNELPVDLYNFYLENSDNKDKKFIRKKNIVYSEPKEPKLFDKQKWFDYIDADIISLPVDLIFVNEDIHLETKSINFGKKIKEFKENNMIDKPIAVRKNGENYTLIAGMSRLCAAKLLGFKTIPAVIQDISHAEFILKYVI